MDIAFAVIVIILSGIMVALVLMQNKGADLGGFLGGGASGDLGGRTRRGVELLLHRITIATSIVFFICVAITFFIWG